MLITLDERIPYLADWLSAFAHVQTLPAHVITPDNIKNSEILIVRTVTPITQNFIAAAPQLRVIASATSGIDHIDHSILNAHQLHCYSAHGCNAIAVENYVYACIAALRCSNHLPNKMLTLGIVGVGQIGQRVATTAKTLGWNVILYDPVRATHDPNFISASLNELKTADVITLHAALHDDAPYPSRHLLTKDFLKTLKPKTVLINSARGELIDERALLEYADQLILCLDVWAEEPNIHPTLLEKSFIATPHIAGYSQQSKWRASWMIFQALCQHYHWPMPSTALTHKITNVLLNAPSYPHWENSILEIFNPLLLTQQMKLGLTSSSLHTHFKTLRDRYVLRKEFSEFQLTEQGALTQDDLFNLKSLGINLSLKLNSLCYPEAPKNLSTLA